MEAVGKIINTYKPFAVCTQELSRELQQALYPHINDDYNCYEGTFASSLPLNQHTRGCANGIMLRSDAKFVKGGTVHFRTTTMGYDFIFAIVEIADGEEALILNTHLESHHKVTDEDGNRKNNVMYTGVFAREDVRNVARQQDIKAQYNLLVSSPNATPFATHFARRCARSKLDNSARSLKATQKTVVKSSSSSSTGI